MYVYVLFDRTKKYIKKWTELKWKTLKSTIAVGDFNKPLPVTEKTSKEIIRIKKTKTTWLTT